MRRGQPHDVPDEYDDTQVPRLSYDVESTRQKIGSFHPKSFNRPTGVTAPPKLLSEDGLVYHGEWKECVPNGLGTMYFPDGSLYEGLFVQGNN